MSLKEGSSRLVILIVNWFSIKTKLFFFPKKWKGLTWSSAIKFNRIIGSLRKMKNYEGNY